MPGGFLSLKTKPRKSGIIFTMKTFISKSPEDTIEFAIKFSSTLKGGEVLALKGDLGAGKTTFAKGLAEGLKVADTITSPTFVILKEYSAKIKDKQVSFVHIDAYRAETIADIESVGIQDYLDRDDVVMVIEWPEKIKEILPENTIWIKFENINEQERKISYDLNN